MAAIDPSAEPEHTEGGSSQPRATLKLIRAPLIDMDDDEDSDFDPEEMDAMLASDEDGESSDEDANGGPSDPAKSKKARKAAAVKQLRKELAEDMEVDDAPKAGKGKGKVLDISEDFEDDDEDSDEDDEDFEPEEFVLCTLDPSKVCFTPHYSIFD
jgi:FK506-binding nuclear protein